MTEQRRESRDPNRRASVRTAPAKGPASYFPSIERTYGESIDHWKSLIRNSPITGHMNLVTWLKNDHGLGHGHANALVASTLAEDRVRVGSDA